MQKFDAKFSGVIFKIKNGTIVPDDEYMVFLAKDAAFPATLRFYRDECARLGADTEQLDAIDRALQNWRSMNMNRIKVPDAKGEKLVG